MRRNLPFSVFILLAVLACSFTPVSAPIAMPSMDVGGLSTAVVQTADALATANGVHMLATSLSAPSPSPIPTDTPIVVTATITETPSATPSASPTASPVNTAALTFTATKAQSTATLLSTGVSSTTIPPTAIPPTVVTPTAKSACPAGNSAYAAQVVELINAQRANAGLSPLSVQSQLGSAAQLHSEDMACNNYFSHSGLDSSTVATRIERQGYHWSAAGENIGAGYSSPESVVSGWMNSDGHRANILSADFTEIGIGYAFGADSDYGAYWTAVLARP